MVDGDGVAVVDLDVVVECSSGTYVRALARDLGAALGTGGHLTALRRTRVGPFTLAEAQGLDGAGARGQPDRRGGPPLLPRPGPDAPNRPPTSGYGRRLPDTALPGERTAVFDPDGEFLALYRPDGGDAVPEAVFVG